MEDSARVDRDAASQPQHPEISDDLAAIAGAVGARAHEGDPFGPDGDERARRSIGIALIVTASVIVGILLATGAYIAWALTVPLPSPTVTWRTPVVETPSAARIAMPDTGSMAISVAGADAYLGAEAAGIWQSSGSQDPQPIASISKIITALVVLDAFPLADASDPGPTITFSKADHDLYDQYYVRGATIVTMPTGSSMSLHDALATMLVPSASNYADAVATWAFGSTSGYRSAARAWLAEHGLTGTTIVEPTGLNADNVSTPADLIEIGKLAAANPTIAALAGSAWVNIPERGVLTNTNDLLGTSGITGLKTGNLGYGTFALLYTATVPVGTDQPLSIVGVRLGGATRTSVADDVVDLLTSIREGFRTTILIERGDDVGEVTTAWGSSARVVAAADASVLTWSDTPIVGAFDAAPQQDFADGATLGTMTWTAGPASASVDLLLDGEIQPPTGWWRLTHPAELG